MNVFKKELGRAKHVDLIEGIAKNLAVTPDSLTDDFGNIRWMYDKAIVNPNDLAEYWRASGDGIAFYTLAGTGGITMSGLSAGILIPGTEGGLASLFCGNSDGWVSDKPIVLGDLWGDPLEDGTIIRDGSIEVQGPNSYSAQGNEVVTAKDLRVNAAGGMRLGGSNGAYAGYGAATSIAIADFDVTFVVTPRWTDMRNRQLFTQEAGGDHLAFEFGNDAGTTDMSQGAYVIWYRAGVARSAYTGYTLQQLKDRGPCVVRFTRDGAGNVTPRLNGVALTWNVTPTPYLGDVIRMFGGIIGGYGQFEGDVLRSRIANFEMTDDEAAGAAKGESRGRLAYRGYVGNAAAATNGHANWSVWDTTFTAPDANSLTLAGTAGNRAATWVLPVKHKRGQTIRFRATASGVTGGAISLAAQSTDGLHNIFAPGAGVNYGVITNGSVDITLTPDFDVDDLTIFGTAGVAQGVTLVGIAVSVEGTVADYRPEEVTSLNRWLDGSGNGYHLLPVAGATALNPQVPRRREASFEYNTIAPALTRKDSEFVSVSSDGLTLTGTLDSWIPDSTVSTWGSCNRNATGPGIVATDRTSSLVYIFQPCAYTTGGPDTFTRIKGFASWIE